MRFFNNLGARLGAHLRPYLDRLNRPAQRVADPVAVDHAERLAVSFQNRLREGFGVDPSLVTDAFKDRVWDNARASMLNYIATGLTEIDPPPTGLDAQWTAERIMDHATLVAVAGNDGKRGRLLLNYYDLQLRGQPGFVGPRAVANAIANVSAWD